MECASGDSEFGLMEFIEPQGSVSSSSSLLDVNHSSRRSPGMFGSGLVVVVVEGGTGGCVLSSVLLREGECCETWWLHSFDIGAISR